MSEFSSLGVGELRKLLRERFPQSRGGFAAQADQKTCLAILEGQRTLAECVTEWAHDVASVAGGTDDSATVPASGRAHFASDQPVLPAEGTHTLSAEAGGELTEAARTLRKLEAFQPGMGRLAAAVDASRQDIEALRIGLGKANEEARLARDAAKLALPPLPSFETTGNGTVKIGGVEIPIVGSGDPHVPAVDPDFVFSAWRGERKAGAVTFRWGVGDLVRAIMADSRVLLIGPPGVGKTSVLQQIAAAIKWPFFRFNANRDVVVGDFVGEKTVQGGQIVFEDGILTQAMTAGGLLVIDEIDHMPASCSSILHSVTEPGGKLVITSDGGRVVNPAKGFRIAATANSDLFGDEGGLHPNAQCQDWALVSRFDQAFKVGWLTPANERKIIQSRYGTDKALATLIVEVANETRKAVENATLTYAMTLRSTMAWAKAMACGASVGVGFCTSVLNKSPASDGAVLAEIAQRHLGEKIANMPDPETTATP